jgi:hypothetical protein
MARDFNAAKHGSPVEAAGAAYRDEQATANRAPTWWLRWRRWWLDRSDDDLARARLRAVRAELAWRSDRT